VEHLWAPWRMDYIRSKKGQGCIFCVPLSTEGDSQKLILYRGQNSVMIMNRFPYSCGHLMVAPLRHTGDLEGLPPEELGDLLTVMKKAVSLLKRAFSPQGFNIGMNIGQVAGAGIVDHLHIHVVPRWSGDTNFMPIIADTIVVPEYLETTYHKLISVLEDMARGG